MKPWKCELCDYNAGMKAHLKRHVMDVHEKLRPFHCPQCEYTSARKSYLQNHMKKIHKMDLHF